MEYSFYWYLNNNKRGNIFAWSPESMKMNQPEQTAMIIDDNEDMSYLLEGILRTRSIPVLSVHSLGEAKECLANLRPSVIFLDNHFPVGSGISFIRNIKSVDKEIKIIMITADTSSTIKEMAFDEGINYFLEKPFSRQVIDDVLDTLEFRKD